MRVRPFSVMVDKIEYVLLGDYPLKWSDEHMRMRMSDYFTDAWYEDERKDWSDFGTSTTVRRNPQRKRQRLSSQDRVRG